MEPKFTVAFLRRGGNVRISVPGNETRATGTSLIFDTKYRIIVRAEYRFKFCTKKVIGPESLSVVATTAHTGT